MASGFVKIAMDEFYSHNPNNLTGLVQRYWMMVEEDVAGKSIYIFIIILQLVNYVLYDKAQWNVLNSELDHGGNAIQANWIDFFLNFFLNCFFITYFR